jgi:excinuclease ABC subunit A
MAESEPIVVRGAREHNLKNVSLDIPSQKLVVVTGPSGSGKSSLAFDTIFAEGQRRYIESLSAYARQFLEQMSKPDVDFVDGLSPALSIEQKTISTHPRSTVGTVTTLYDFLRLLFARRGEVLDPETGSTLKASTDDDILDFAKERKDAKLQFYASVVRGKKGEFLREFDQWRKAGFTKVRVDGALKDLHDPILLNRHQHHEIDLFLDSTQGWKKDSEARIREAVALADKYAEGWLRVIDAGSKEERLFSRKLASKSTGQAFPDLEPRLFSFNSPYGMCADCKGIGYVEKKGSKKKDEDEDDDELLFHGALEDFELCKECEGARLRPEALQVHFAGKNIFHLSSIPGTELIEILSKEAGRKGVDAVTTRLLQEITTRLKFLADVGVGYLSLGRHAGTLSGGEAQRIRLATQLGSQLSGVLYVLDEPSIGLHPRDQQKLLGSLGRLRDLGNSVLVVEHDEETMLAADHIIDIGPGAGVHGGNVVDAGPPKDFLKSKNSSTAAYLRGEISVSEQRARRAGSGKKLGIYGCSGHNLKDLDLEIPLGKFVVFTGVSGSGKSSLVQDTLEAALAKKLYRSGITPLPHKDLKGLDALDKMVHVDQRPIGRSPRSNPATYTGLFQPLRSIFAQTPDAQVRGYTASTFSFNVKGGRCDGCEGAGRVKIEMHFLPDVYVTCDKCNGSRYRREVLEVRFKGKNISECLQMSVEEAYQHFSNQPLIEPKLKTLVDVGLGYVQLGQAATTLSGGEAQRIKLARELSKRATGKTIYFLDEPTTGLHFQDVRKLVELLQRLCDMGNTIVVIEHNMDVICAADWIFELGPGPAAEGGKIVFQGTPEDFHRKSATATGPFIKDYFARRGWK